MKLNYFGQKIKAPFYRYFSDPVYFGLGSDADPQHCRGIASSRRMVTSLFFGGGRALFCQDYNKKVNFVREEVKKFIY
jgi:hypothetical protein